PKRSSHGPNCSCCSGGSTRPSKTLHHADGSKSFPTKRPWMISH
ncbi:MAG: zinc ribbon domain-containing protein, partial [Pseudomonadota bacterium]